MLNFDILERGVRIVSPSHFVSDFSRKYFLMLYFSTCYILVTDQFQCLIDYFLRCWAIRVLQLFVSQVMTS